MKPGAYQGEFSMEIKLTKRDGVDISFLHFICSDTCLNVQLEIKSCRVVFLFLKLGENCIQNFC